MTAAKLAVGVEEAAAMIGLSERTVWREVADGRLRSFMSRGRRLVRVSQIEAYLDRRELLTAKREPAS